MEKSKSRTDEQVKQVSLTEGFLHIDLFDGLRLSGPLERPAAGAAAKPRLVETAPGSAWSDDMNLDGLMSGPAA